MSPAVVSASLVPVTVSVGAFTAMLPDVAAIRRATRADVNTCKDVRTAEVASSAVTLVIGLTAGAFVKSPYPLYAALVSCVVLVALYEAILSVNPHPNSKVATNVY